jgi:hypothetical protein
VHVCVLEAACGDAGFVPRAATAFVEAICHHTLATPAHLLSLLEPKLDR